VCFEVEGRKFYAHRCWVAALSQPLCAMFESGGWLLFMASLFRICELHDQIISPSHVRHEGEP